MLLPKRVKYRRVHRGRLTGKAMRGNKVTYGEYGLVALEPSWITSNQMEICLVKGIFLERLMLFLVEPVVLSFVFEHLDMPLHLLKVLLAQNISFS